MSANTNGVLVTLDDPVYVASFKNNTLFYVNRDGEMEIKQANASEYEFKVALKN